MPSLSQIVAEQGTILLVDAASARVQTALLEPEKARWACADEEAGTAVYECVKRLAIDLAEVRGFVFCEGPGSILGIRTVAAALRTWKLLGARPAWAYKSLEVVSNTREASGLAVISDARRDSWNLVRPGGRLERVRTEALPVELPLAMPSGFRQWTRLPSDRKLATVSYDLSVLMPEVAGLDLFSHSEEPDAFLHEEPTYATWTPQIHRAPS